MINPADRAILSLELDNQVLSKSGGDGSVGITPPTSITDVTFVQDEKGRWVKDETPSSSEIKKDTQIRAEELASEETDVQNFTDLAKISDDRLLSIATQINEKKQLIITKVTEAISAGCSFGMATAIINGVTVGVGSTVVGDYAYIKKYSGLDNYSSSNPFSSDDTLTLSASNSGTGYFSGFTANAGSTVGTYYTVFYDGFASPPTICATRTAEIDALATEINTLRSQINVALIVNTNTIKDRKTSSEVFVWGYKSRDKKVRNFTSDNDTVMSTIRNESAFQ